MDAVVTNPPWVDGPHNAMQRWLRTVVRRSLLNHSCRRTYGAYGAEDLYQEVCLKVLAYRDGRVEPSQALLHSADIEQILIIRLLRDITLFLSALHAIREALAFVAVTPPKLVKLRDKVKSLNLPIRLIPQSLHPDHTHAAPVGA